MQKEKESISPSIPEKKVWHQPKFEVLKCNKIQAGSGSQIDNPEVSFNT